MVGFSDLARSSPAVFTVGFVENQKWGWPRWIHNHLYSSFGGHNLNEPPTSVECRVIQLLLGHPSNTFGSREICWLKHRKHNECLPRGLASRPCSQSNKVQKSNHGSKQLKEEDDEGSEFEQPIAVQNYIRDCPEIFECCGGCFTSLLPGSDHVNECWWWRLGGARLLGLSVCHRALLLLDVVMKKRFQLFICVQVLFKHILDAAPAADNSSRTRRGGRMPRSCLSSPHKHPSSSSSWLSTSVFNVSLFIWRMRARMIWSPLVDFNSLFPTPPVGDSRGMCWE